MPEQTHWCAGESRPTRFPGSSTAWTSNTSMLPRLRCETRLRLRATRLSDLSADWCRTRVERPYCVRQSRYSLFNRKPSSSLWEKDQHDLNGTQLQPSLGSASTYHFWAYAKICRESTLH